MKFIGNDSSAGKYADPPTSVSATAGNAQATVSFTLPVYDGKQTATYQATSSPGGFTASGSGSPLTVTGLSNGTAYTFTVTTITGYGVSATSAASNSVTPVAPPVAPPPAPVAPPPAPTPVPVAPTPIPLIPPSPIPVVLTLRYCLPGDIGFYGCYNVGECLSPNASGALCG